MRTGVGRVGVMATALALLLAPSILAQDPATISREEQDRLLREAAVMEVRGDRRGAEDRLRTLLEQAPGNASAVFALDRVLTAVGRRGEMLEVVEGHLEHRPESPNVRALELRLLAGTGRYREMDRAVREWVERDPGSLSPFAESVQLYHRLQGPEKALEVVREARDETDRDDVLALEAGDFLAELDRPREAVAEWVRTIRGQGRLSSVVRRIRSLPGDTRDVIATLAEELEEQNPTAEELRSVARLALDAGAQELAVEIAERALEEMEERVRRGFLVQFASRAEDMGAPSVALWGLQRVRESSRDVREIRSLDERMAELSLAMGDTARALEAWDRVSSSFPEESVQRRRAIATALEVEIQTLPPRDAARRIEEFRAEFPEAPELDRLSGRVAIRLLEDEDWDRAQELLAGVQGPRSALNRAYLQLQGGEKDAALEELRNAQENVAPAEATEVLHLLTFLQGAEEDAAALGGRVAALVHWDRTDEALELLDDEIDAVTLDDRPGLLALGARLAEREGRDEAASRLRGRLVAEFPDAPETPEAAVRLARHLAGVEGRAEDARLILEELILSRPESAVVPEARRELQRIRAGGRRNP